MTRHKKEVSVDEPMSAGTMLKVAGAGVAIVICSPVIIGFCLLGWMANKRERKERSKPQPRRPRVIKVLG